MLNSGFTPQISEIPAFSSFSSSIPAYREATYYWLPKMRFVSIESNYMYWLGFETWNDSSNVVVCLLYTSPSPRDA